MTAILTIDIDNNLVSSLQPTTAYAYGGAHLVANMFFLGGLAHKNNWPNISSITQWHPSIDSNQNQFI